MRKIDQYFVTKVSKTLFHYTGIGSLIGIVKSQSVWAGNIHYLNDSREIIEGYNILDLVIEDSARKFSSSSIEFNFLNQLKSWVNISSTQIYDVFVFSLSEEPNLLSQWRGYTPHGKGVSLGFSKFVIENLIINSNLKLARCLYETEEKFLALSVLVGKLLETFLEEKDAIDISKAVQPCYCYHTYIGNFRSEILLVLSIIKAEEFKEEKEWRLILPYDPTYTLHKIEYREGASMLVPYVEFFLGEQQPYFEVIRLGPSPHENLSMNALSNFCFNKKLCSSVLNCGIPYREWQ